MALSGRSPLRAPPKRRPRPRGGRPARARGRRERGSHAAPFGFEDDVLCREEGLVIGFDPDRELDRDEAEAPVLAPFNVAKAIDFHCLELHPASLGNSRERQREAGCGRGHEELLGAPLARDPAPELRGCHNLECGLARRRDVGEPVTAPLHGRREPSALTMLMIPPSLSLAQSASPQLALCARCWPWGSFLT